MGQVAAARVSVPPAGKRNFLGPFGFSKPDRRRCEVEISASREWEKPGVMMTMTFGVEAKLVFAANPGLTERQSLPFACSL
jgi:hypothetical protein